MVLLLFKDDILIIAYFHYYLKIYQLFFITVIYIRYINCNLLIVFGINFNLLLVTSLYKDKLFITLLLSLCKDILIIPLFYNNSKIY